MKGWRFVLLVLELFLFALILVLPQVDLPDFTFPRGTAPISARSRLTAPPALSVIPATIQARAFSRIVETRDRELQTSISLNPLSPQDLSCLLRC